MTINSLKINGTDLSELNSKQTTDLVRALLAHRKTLNESARKERDSAKAARKTKQLATKAARATKLREQLAALEAAA
jgi:hypothetical protein